MPTPLATTRQSKISSQPSEISFSLNCELISHRQTPARAQTSQQTVNPAQRRAWRKRRDLF